MGATLQTVSAITKQVYGPRVVKQVDDSLLLVKRIEKTSRNTTSTANGKEVKIPLKVRRNQGIGYRNELEQLQSPGQQGWTEVTVPLRYGYGRVQITGQTVELVNENSSAFASAMTEEMSGLRDDLVKDSNRILWGNQLGVLGTVATAGAAVNTVDVGAGYDDVKWFQMDMQVDVLSSDGLTVRAANRKVTGIDETNGVITIDGAAVTSSVGDIVVRTGNYGREPQGLQSLVKAGGTLFGLSSTTEPIWNSTVTTAVGTLTESAMITHLDLMRTKSGNKRPSVIWADLLSRRAYWGQLQSMRRFTNTQSFEGGLKGLAFSYDDDIPLIADVDAPKGTLHFLNEDDFTLYHRKEWDWDDKAGSVWQQVQGYDAYTATMKKYWEFACERRNTQGKMTGITG